MKTVKDLNGLEFAELLHEVCERLEQEKQTCVHIQRPNYNDTYIVIGDDENVYPAEHVTPVASYLSVNNAYISSRVKL